MELILQKWNEIIESIKIEHEVSNIAFTTWLVPLKPYKLEGNTLFILTPKELAISYIERKYSLAIMVAVAEFTGMEYQISFISNEDIDKKDLSPKETPKKTDALSVATAAEKANLNPKYTFDTFIVGSNNRFAHSAALAVAEEPGELYNPLFLYGGAGLGKTHLMHSIAHYILEKNPEARVLYTTSEAFTNELIESIRNGNSSSMSKFRDKYRNIDVLLIDDRSSILIFELEDFLKYAETVGEKFRTTGFVSSVGHYQISFVYKGFKFSSFVSEEELREIREEVLPPTKVTEP